ncbi:MAG: hypothetical protein FJY19_06725 [Bacteroidetes bacterium]|nr:hypothetical protein [Bacteroidota bacterium]
MRYNSIVVFILALFIGMGVNTGMLLLGSQVIPLPPGLDTSTRENLRYALPLLEVRHFLFPFLAHAMGTLAGAFLVSGFAKSNVFIYAMLIAGFFFLGGLSTIVGMPSPLWFSIMDLLLAYFPMAWLAYNFAIKLKPLQSITRPPAVIQSDIF